MSGRKISPVELDNAIDGLWQKACPNRIDHRKHPGLYRAVQKLRQEYWSLMEASRSMALRLAEAALTQMANSGEVKVPERTSSGGILTAIGAAGNSCKVLFHGEGTRFEYTREAMHCMERARHGQAMGDAAERHGGEGMD